MKKIITILLVVSLCLSTLFLNSCFTKDPLEEFVEKMSTAENYQMKLTMSDVPFFGTLTFLCKVDGKITYTSVALLEIEQYTATIGDTEYLYEKNESGVWTKTVNEDAGDAVSDVIGDNSLEELFNPENFEKADGKKNTYKQKSGVTFDSFENVVITIEEDSCTIEMTITTDEMECEAKIVISKIGEIELTLPNVS